MVWSKCESYETLKSRDLVASAPLSRQRPVGMARSRWTDIMKWENHQTMTKKNPQCLQNEETQDYDQITISSEGGQDTPAHQIACRRSHEFPSKYSKTSTCQMSGNSCHAFSGIYLEAQYLTRFKSFGLVDFEIWQMTFLWATMNRLVKYTGWKMRVCVNSGCCYAGCCIIARNWMANVLRCNSIATSTKL